MNYTKFLCWLAGTSFALSASASIQINEIMVRNSSAIINENFNFEGWVEVYNSGDESVDLSKCYFTDTDDDIFKWQNKATTTIAPKGYAIFYFDELNKTNHASFKLDCDGGLLVLSDENGNELDRVNYPKTYRNTSYGRTEDGGLTFGHLLTATQGAGNTSAVAKKQTVAPTFSQTGVFYDAAQSISITASDPSATIYYTTNGSEPKAETANKYTTAVNVSATTVLRAIAVVDGEASSDITTATYFVGNTIPVSTKVVSIASDNDYLYGDKLGALVVGTNGSTVPTNCASSDKKANYMNDWDRPCNVEVFDESNVQRISQEVKFSAFGACSRTKPIKSIAIKANKVYGSNKLDYTLFSEKPNLKWKSFVLRNSGNDFGRMLFRDGYLQTLASSGMDIDHQAYEPTVVFVNGKYYGMLGLRERTNKDFIYSNYGLSEDEICIESTPDSAADCNSYQEVLDIANNTNASFADINNLIDVNELLNYFTTEIYYCNEDWSAGNIKAWKRLQDGKWRWILYDTDYSTSLYGDYLSTDGFTYANKCDFFPLLLNNTDVKKRLMNKFTLQTGTTFAEEHVSAVLDSMINLLNDEADYYFKYLLANNENEASSWRAECEKVRNFITARPDYLFSQVAKHLSLGTPSPLRICSDIEGTTYELNGLETINKADFRSYYFNGEALEVKANAPDGYKFKQWEVCKEKYLLPAGSTWKYLYQSTSADATWKTAGFDDASWKEGAAPLGSGLSYFVKTTVSGSSNSGWGNFGGFGGFGGWGGFGTSVNTTTYLRNTFNIEDLAAAGDLFCTMKANDGVVIYINGQEAYRFNIDANEQYTDTAKAMLEMDSYALRQFYISKDLLTEGENTIAVELHNASGSSSIAFDLSLQDSNNSLEVLSNSLQEDYTTTFSDSLTLKAVFDEDPDWTEDSLKLYINEVCVANKQYVDEYREDDDWIELYNDGTSAVDLGGMYISDDTTNLMRYLIPSGYGDETTIPAKGYLIIWADKDSTQGPLHTNFQLDKKKNETITLSRILNGTIDIIDSVKYQSHTKGNSYARFSYVGDGAWSLTSVPTFNARNVFAPDHSASITTDVELAEASGFDVRIYPNPVDDYLWFALGNESLADVTIMNYTGQQMLHSTIENGGSIYVGDLKPSVYLINIKTSGHTFTIKFVKR